MLPDWSRTEIAGKPADLFEPAPQPGRTSRAAVLYLHPLGGESPADSTAYTAAFRAAGLPVVAPHGRRSWWADRICKEFDPSLTAERHLLANVVPWMEAQWGLGRRAIAAVGVSMGGQAAIRLGFKYPDRFPVVAGVSSAFDFQDRYGLGEPLDGMYPSREACRQDSAVLHVGGPPWPGHVWFACDPADVACFRGNDRMHEKLRAVGVPHEVAFDATAGGHAWAYFDLMAARMARFAADALAQQSRRLL